MRLKLIILLISKLEFISYIYGTLDLEENFFDIVIHPKTRHPHHHKFNVGLSLQAVNESLQ